MIIKNIYEACHKNDLISCILNREDFDNVLQQLVNLDCGTVQIDRYRTVVRDWYFGFINPSFAYLLQAIPGFTDVEAYPSRCFAFKDEIGTIGNIRFIKNRSALLGSNGSRFLISVGSFGDKDNPVSKKLLKNPSQIDFSNPHHVHYFEGIIMIVKNKEVT
jgi:hypothetical protein